MPSIFLPPIPRPPPRPRSRHNFPAHPAPINPHRLLVPHLHPQSLRRPHHAKPRHSSLSVVSLLSVWLTLSAPLVLLTRNNQSRYPKTLRPMVIHQLRATHIPLSHQLPQPRNRHFQLLRVRPARHKQSVLHHARRRSIRHHVTFLNRRRPQPPFHLPTHPTHPPIPLTHP